MKVSVVVESLTPRERPGSISAAAGPVLRGLADQSLRPDEIVFVLVDGEHADAEQVRREHPDVAVAYASAPNYFAMKNAGARVATGDVIALCDGDTVPDPRWLEHLVAALSNGAIGVAAGRTVYRGDGAVLRALSHAGFGIVEQGDVAQNFVINNIAYRREVLLTHPFDERIRRDGGCYLQHHALRRAGVVVTYASDAIVAHEPEQGIGWVKKHYNRGVDGVQVHRLDHEQLLRGSTWFRRFGPLALPPITARRLALDLRRVAWARRRGATEGVPVPVLAAVIAFTRSVELVGGLVASLKR